MISFVSKESLKKEEFTGRVIRLRQVNHEMFYLLDWGLRDSVFNVVKSLNCLKEMQSVDVDEGR